VTGEGLLKKKVVEIRVSYADTDAMGIVYHSNYVRWFEIGRTEMMRDMGIVYARLEKEGFYLPVTQLYCHYLAPARYDDIVQIETAINYFRMASIKFDYEIKDERGINVLVEGYTVHAFTNRQGKIVRAPRTISERIRGS
jgi:acyl-CoA thioester hydrolase